MALIFDTGPIFASLDRSDAYHEASRQLIMEASEPLIIPSPVLVEVDYWVHQRLDQSIFNALLDDIADGSWVVENLIPQDYPRIHDLCHRYEDADIGFVDAAVFTVVERLNETKLATIDRRNFGLLRPRHVDALLLLPDG